MLERSESMVFHDGARIEVPVRTLDDGTIDEPCLFVLAGEVAVDGAAPRTLTPGHFVDDVASDTTSALYAVGDVRAGTRPYLNEAVADGERAAKAIVAALKKTN